MKKPVSVLLSTVLAASLAFWAVPFPSVAYADATAHASEENVSTQEGAEHNSSAYEQDDAGQVLGTKNSTNTPASEAVESPTGVNLQLQATNEYAGESAYAHAVSASQNGVTFTVSWNDAPAGAATTFHVAQTGGSSAAKARMDVPTYWDTDNSQESVCDPTRSQWDSYYELGDTGHDFSFELTASGTYRINFYFMDTDSNVWYLRTTATVTVNDAARPSVTQIISNAVAQCRAEITGSEYDMALWLHDWTLDQLEYDHSLNWCSAESGLTRGLGTCESYQRIYAKLLNAAGIANGRVEGNGHTWNAVRIDGRWSQMDLTWDDTDDNWYGDLDQRHLYFGLTDELMAIAHSDHAKNYQADGYAYRSTDLSNDYFVRNGKADEWADAYASCIQQHLDARETSFSIDADNASFPPSISGIQNAIVAHAMNQREWSVADGSVALTATSNVTTISSYEWSARFDFNVKYPETPSTPEVNQASISYQPHVSELGWLNAESDGDQAGTTGMNLGIEALRIDLAGIEGEIEISSLSEDAGWSDWSTNETGTTGQHRALQAVKVKLAGKAAEVYDVYYQGHITDYGWLGWAKNGEASGTSDAGKTFQAIKIIIVLKGANAPGSTEGAFQESDWASIRYESHISDVGWIQPVADGAISGTEEEGRRMEAIKITLKSSLEGGVKMRAHVADDGWLDWTDDIAGTTGQCRRMEAIQIILEGDITSKYNVFYRTYAPGYGWQDWVSNGKVSGTTGLSRQLSAIEIKLVEKT